MGSVLGPMERDTKENTKNIENMAKEPLPFQTGESGKANTIEESFSVRLRIYRKHNFKKFYLYEHRGLLMGKGNKAARKGWKKKYGGVHKRDSGVTNCDECGLWPCMNPVCYPPHEDCDFCHCD